MDSSSNSDNEKFLNRFRKPYERVLCLTLYTAVIIIAIIDIVIGTMGFSTMITLSSAKQCSQYTLYLEMQALVNMQPFLSRYQD
ncbi:unnamed protein product [Blepharisma stoltei]|uniref:Uncharacterized protein n=1 Tax=Blepharisma stoltei TaxID=1481888 RepID=A0AAU9JN44_9CILI|nr:unnamed protein product [Blepharisma stoltei]